MKLNPEQTICSTAQAGMHCRWSYMRARFSTLAAVSAVLIVLMLGVPAPVQAQASSLAEATTSVKEANPGCRILKADEVRRDDGTSVYRLKLLTANGTVRTVNVPGSNKRSADGVIRRRVRFTH